VKTTYEHVINCFHKFSKKVLQNLWTFRKLFSSL